MFMIKVTTRGVPAYSSINENGPIIGYDSIHVYGEVVNTQDEVDAICEGYAEDPEGIESVEVIELDFITVGKQHI